jgi:hypothetical protein
VAEKKLAAVLFLPSTGSRPTMMPSIITGTAAAGLGKENTAPLAPVRPARRYTVDMSAQAHVTRSARSDQEVEIL